MATQATNMYRVGDFVYSEETSDAPYQIRRIDDLNKTPTGVEARVTLFYRRRDIPPALLKIADQAQRRFDDCKVYEVEKRKLEKFNDAAGFTVANGDDIKKEEIPEGHSVDVEEEVKTVTDWGNGGLPLGTDGISQKDRLTLRHHEIFLTRQVETMPVSQIRGKCRVTLLSEVETYEHYLNEDTFFYSLVFDPSNMSLLADKGAIRVGERYQAEVWDEEEEQKHLEEEMNKLNGEEKERDVLVFRANNGLEDRDIDQYLIIARAIGTFARALDPTTSSKLTSLHMTVAYASRDITVAHAMAILHQADYDVGQAVKFLVPPANKALYPLVVDETSGNFTTSLGGPILCRDQLEEWSAAEANLFEEAVEKYGKDFNDVKADYLPWKSMRNIVEYYYLFKSSNRYVDHKKKKLAEQEAKLKQVYIPAFNKTCSNIVGAFNSSTTALKGVKSCEDCQAEESINWYSWGGSKVSIHLCTNCWSHWKRNGGLTKKHPSEMYDKTEPPTNTNNGNGSGVTAMVDLKSSVTVNPFSINRNAPLNVQQKAAIVSMNTTQQVIAQLPANHPLVMAAKEAAAKGYQLTNLASLANFSLLNFSGAGASSSVSIPSTSVGARKVLPNTRTVVFYVSNIWRRVMRRILPKEVLNIRRLSRKPFGNLNLDAVVRSLTAADKTQMFTMAKIAAGARNFTESDFVHGLVQLQSQINSSLKRGADSPAQGEPSEKRQKLLSTSSTSQLECPPSTSYAPSPAPPPPPLQQQSQSIQFVPPPSRRDSIWMALSADVFTYVAGSTLKAKRCGLFPRGGGQLRHLVRRPFQPFAEEPIALQYLLTSCNPSAKKYLEL